MISLTYCICTFVFTNRWGINLCWISFIRQTSHSFGLEFRTTSVKINPISSFISHCSGIAHCSLSQVSYSLFLSHTYNLLQFPPRSWVYSQLLTWPALIPLIRSCTKTSEHLFRTLNYYSLPARYKRKKPSVKINSVYSLSAHEMAISAPALIPDKSGWYWPHAGERGDFWM